MSIVDVGWRITTLCSNPIMDSTKWSINRTTYFAVRRILRVSNLYLFERF